MAHLAASSSGRSDAAETPDGQAPQHIGIPRPYGADVPGVQKDETAQQATANTPSTNTADRDSPTGLPDLTNPHVKWLVENEEALKRDPAVLKYLRQLLDKRQDREETPRSGSGGSSTSAPATSSLHPQNCPSQHGIASPNPLIYSPQTQTSLQDFFARNADYFANPPGFTIPPSLRDPENPNERTVISTLEFMAEYDGVDCNEELNAVIREELAFRREEEAKAKGEAGE